MPEEAPPQTIPGKLYVVATPIGNLDDLTFRALKTLEDVDCIACEDTRHTRKLLARYELRKKLISYFEPREKQKIPLILEMLKEGKEVALVSDAGTPGVSDPGFPLIREVIRSGFKVVPIPGVSAVTTALSAAGLPTDRFLFLGFPPPKKQATQNLLETLAQEKATLIFYLPARKILTFLDNIVAALGERQVVIAREMTKLHEEFQRGTPVELQRMWEKKTPKGEVTVLIEGYRKKKK
jgi:16S rRNA (cytidine1402-2'-O)-methyltransferase